MDRRLYGLAILLVVAVVACAGTSRSSTMVESTETAAAPNAVRYKLDAIRVDDGTTYQGTLEVRGARAILHVDRAPASGARDKRWFDGTLERGDVTSMTFAERDMIVGELECADDGRGLHCTPRGGDRIFHAQLRSLRFERLSLRISGL